MRRRTKSRGTPEVHQFVPSLGYRDATGNHTLQTQRALADRELKGGVWVISVHPELDAYATHYREFTESPSAAAGNSALLYQASTGAHEMVEYLLDRPEEKFIYYHNITPSQFFEPYDAAAAVQMDMGRAEMARLCKSVSVAMANSEYSARELRDWGVEDVTVVPPYLMAHTPRPSRGRLSWLTRTKRGIDVLFVGRVVPNKGHMHLLRAFTALRAASDREARLFIAGAWGPQLYMLAIQKVRERLGDAGVTLTGSITESSLAAHYRAADVFVCLSEHEGFCIPLVEAMRNGVPVVAYDAGAVGETLGGTGVLLRTLDPLVVAETVYRVATDETLRTELIEGQKKRAAELETFPRDEAIVTNAHRALRL